MNLRKILKEAAIIAASEADASCTLVCAEEGILVHATTEDRVVSSVVSWDEIEQAIGNIITWEIRNCATALQESSAELTLLTRFDLQRL